MRISTKVTCRPALPNYVSGDDRSPADLILKCEGSNPAAPTSQSVSNASNMKVAQKTAQAHPGRADGLICVNPSAPFIGSCQWRNPRVTTRSVVSGS